MKKTAAVFVLFLASSSMAHADHRAEGILSWISEHLQPVSYTVTTPHATYPEYESAKVEFSGCNVQIIDDLKTQKSSIQTRVAFSLRNIEADMIRFKPESSSGDTQVTPYFLVQLPLVSAVPNTTTFATSSGSQTNSAASSSISIVFQDQSMANRQANAWRDAALACGAR